jgi:hypothetical protein
VGVKRTFRHLSRSIADTRKPVKNNGWCYAVFLLSDPQAKLFDGISDGKSFGSSRLRVGKSCSFFFQNAGSMQVSTFKRRYSSSRSPYARRWMTRILLFKPSTKPSETLFSGLQ